MASGPFTLYESGHLGFWNGSIEFESGTVSAVLLSDAYTPSASHSTYADVSGSEIADADYSPQGVTGKTVTYAGGVKVDSDDIQFGTEVSITAKYLVLVQQSGGSLASSDSLIGYVDLNTSGNLSSTNSVFSVSPSESGLVTDTPA